MRVPFSDNQNDARIFCSHGSQLRPTLSGWHGKPPEEGDETTLFLEGKNFSIHDTHVIAGGKPATSVLVSRQLLQVTIPKDAVPHPECARELASRHQRRDAQRSVQSSSNQDATGRCSSPATPRRTRGEAREGGEGRCGGSGFGQGAAAKSAAPALEIPRRCARKAARRQSGGRPEAASSHPGFVKPPSRCAAAYFAALSIAFMAPSSQQTVISLPPTLTLIPPSVISQSQTGHFIVSSGSSTQGRMRSSPPPCRKST